MRVFPNLMRGDVLSRLENMLENFDAAVMGLPSPTLGREHGMEIITTSQAIQGRQEKPSMGGCEWKDPGILCQAHELIGIECEQTRLHRRMRGDVMPEFRITVEGEHERPF